MKGYNLWSYAPYRPLLTEIGDIYICRIVPYETSIYFEWLKAADEYTVFYRKRGEKSFCCYKTVSATKCDILNLETETDYEFYVQSGEKKSRVRLARTGKSIGTVVNYLHPDDEAYDFSGRYLCSPSFVKHPDGYILASMDLFAHNKPQKLTIIFRSDDNGESWHYVNELYPCYWGQLFLHKGEIYMLSCSTEYGDLLISKSTDGGATFPAPVSLLRGSNEAGICGVHKSPQNMIYHNGRLYATLEWGSWRNEKYCHAAMMMSCDENADLLVPENWSFTEPKMFTPNDAPELADMPERSITIEGTPVVAPDGKLLNFMRFGKPGYTIAYEANTENPEEILKYSKCVKFDGHYSKFMIRYDEVSKKYFTLANYIYDYENILARNVVALMVSDDLENWEVVKHVIDMRDSSWEKVACQYVFFDFDKDDIIFLGRTAVNGANSYHNSNYITFHRVKKFRSLLK